MAKPPVKPIVQQTAPDVEAEGQSSPPPSAPASIISLATRKNQSKGANSVLITGRNGTGKTHNAIGLAKGKTLVLAFGGVDTYENDPRAEKFDFTPTLNGWNDVNGYVTSLRRDKSINGITYDTIIVDDIHLASERIMQSIAGAGQPEIQHYNELGRKMQLFVQTLLGATNTLVITVNFSAQADGTFDAEMNRYTYNRLKSLCSGVHYTYVKVLRYNDAGEVVDYAHRVQTNKILALNQLVSAE